MIKEYVSKGFQYFFYIFGCLWLTVLVGAISTLISRFALAKDSIEETVIILVIMSIVMSISLYICFYRNGYADREFNLKMILIPIAIALILQMIYALVFSFSLYTAGPAYYAGATHYLLQGGTKLGVPDEFVFPYMLLFDILYIFVFLAGEYFGVKKRNKDRETLISQSNK